MISVGMMLLYKVMRLSSQKWEDEQTHLAAQGHQRSYIVLEVAKGTSLASARERIQHELWSVPKALPLDSFTFRARSKLFRMLSGLLCNLEAVCGRFHRTFPFLLFRILEGHEQSKSVYNAPHCTRDEMAMEFFRLYPTVQDSQCQEAIAWLQAAALFCQVDIADVECGHSSIREFTKQRGRGHTPEFSAISSRVMCRFLCKQTDLKELEKKEQGQQQQQPQGGEEEVKVKKRRTGCGGPWRAFCQERSKGTQFTHSSIEILAQQYRALSHDEYQYYKELGMAMTIQGAWRRFQSSSGMLNNSATAGDQVVAAAAIPTAALLDLDGSTSVQLLTLGPSFEQRLANFWANMSLERRNILKEKTLCWQFFFRENQKGTI